jgi:CHAD domain-containing protein/HD superfamily phosphodiesterase
MKTSAKTTGLRYWMLRVLDECAHVAADFSADPVHDLRVALRRCRSMADGLMAMDPDPDWKAMKKAGKRLFQRLGELRDTQIMMEWIDKLQPHPARKVEPLTDGIMARSQLAEGAKEILLASSPDHEASAGADIHAEHHHSRDPAANALLTILRAREAEQKREAHAALEEFDHKRWRHWSKSLPRRAARVQLGSPLFKHLALERWTAARHLHNRALRNRSQIAFHTLRIGIKRFRYIVENFLPHEHKAWSNDLKEIQDLLGEVHDLDVLWATAISCHIFADEESKKRWHARILEERTKRLDRYRKKMTGPGSLWTVWRAALPHGPQIQAIATRRMKLWAKALDPDFAHSERVARLALEIYDGLGATGLLTTMNGKVPNANHARASLSLAALLHDVGKSQGEKGHHKASFELIRSHTAPLGWNQEDMQRAAIVARFHRGALPTRNHKALRDLLPDEQKITVQLAAILRLANAFDAAHDGHIRRVRIENPAKQSDGHPRRSDGLPRKRVTFAKNEALVISAEGYTPGEPTAQPVAAERHLLESLLRRPIIVKASSPLRRQSARGAS